MLCLGMHSNVMLCFMVQGVAGSTIMQQHWSNIEHFSRTNNVHVHQNKNLHWPKIFPIPVSMPTTVHYTHHTILY